MSEPPRIFIAYARQDAPLLEKLRRHLNVLQRNRHCHIFYDGKIIPGERWDGRLKAELHSAHIFVLLVTDEFLDSDYINEVELPKVLEREKAGDAGVVPVILRDCLWEYTVLKDLQVVLKDGNPIAPADAYAHAAREIFRVIEVRNANLEQAKETRQEAEKKAEQEKKDRKALDPFQDQMVKIPGGSFDMGDTSGKGRKNEKPVHRVTVPEFHLCKYPVTQGQWQEIMEDNPSYFKGDGQLPVEMVSWQDAQEFIQKLNERTGVNYRLPSEAEWEYAAKGGAKSKGFLFAGSNNLDEVAWYSSNSGSQTHPVGLKQPNELGLYDMSGNVYEWCQDVWHDNYNGAPVDGAAWMTGGEQARRVVRGGSWISYGSLCRCAYRFRGDTGGRDFDIGFRLARS